MKGLKTFFFEGDDFIPDEPALICNEEDVRSIQTICQAMGFYSEQNFFFGFFPIICEI